MHFRRAKSRRGGGADVQSIQAVENNVLDTHGAGVVVRMRDNSWLQSARGSFCASRGNSVWLPRPASPV
jgi:hypothetical protein